MQTKLDDITNTIDWDTVYHFVEGQLPIRLSEREPGENTETVIRDTISEILEVYMDKKFMHCFDIKIKRLKSNKLSIKLQKGNELLSAWSVECA